jgi:hypothetical protein
MKKNWLIILTGILLGIVSCSKDEVKKNKVEKVDIVGTWIASSGKYNLSMKITSSGYTFLLTEPGKGGVIDNGTYEISDEGKIMFTNKDNPLAIGVLKNEKLSLTFVNSVMIMMLGTEAASNMTFTLSNEGDNTDGNGSSILSFSDVVKSNYTATGTPGFLVTPGPSPWTGELIPSTGTDRFYMISNWGGTSVNVYCDYKNEKIVMDSYTKVVDDNEAYEGYFQAIAINISAKTYYAIDDDYIVAYDKTTRIMNFSGTHKGLPVYVGVIAKNKTTGKLDGGFTELYANAKLVLTPASQLKSSFLMKAEAFSCSASISPEKLKDFTQELKNRE